MAVTSIPTRRKNDLGASLLRSFERHLGAENLRPQTVKHYVGASFQFLDFCAAQRLPDIEHISREHIEMWLEDLHRTCKPYTVKNRFVGLRIFLKWCFSIDAIEKDPTARIKPPRVEEVDKDIASPGEIKAVLNHLERETKMRYNGKDSLYKRTKAARDAAIIALLYECGLRATEVAELRFGNVNFLTGVVTITKTKNHQTRKVQLSPKGLDYLESYLRTQPERDELFIGKKGEPMTRYGIYELVRSRFKESGSDEHIIGAHDLRHTSASHVVLAGGMDINQMMTAYGWQDASMARHYTRQVAEQSALDAQLRASPLMALFNNGRRKR